jgi:integrase
MTDLAGAAEDYLTIRRALGLKLVDQGRLLTQFVGYLRAAGAVTVTTEHALAWATKPAAADPVWWNARLSVARGFAVYLQTLDPAAEIPPQGLLPRRSTRIQPYIYSAADIDALLAAARLLPSPLRAATYETFVGLLAVTGLRVGEAIGLDRGDLDIDGALLTVRRGKFGKTRLLPLHQSTLDALAGYGRRRDQLCPNPKSASLFVSTVGTPLIETSVEAVSPGWSRPPACTHRPGDADPARTTCGTPSRSTPCWAGTAPG